MANRLYTLLKTITDKIPPTVVIDTRTTIAAGSNGGSHYQFSSSKDPFNGTTPPSTFYLKFAASLDNPSYGYPCSLKLGNLPEGYLYHICPLVDTTSSKFPKESYWIGVVNETLMTDYTYTCHLDTVEGKRIAYTLHGPLLLST